MNDITKDLATRINQEHQLATAALRESLTHALVCGELLLEAKEQAGHGHFMNWLADNCEVSDRTARLYMRLAKNRPQLDKMATVANLTMREAVKLLEEPKETTAFERAEELLKHPDPELSQEAQAAEFATAFDQAYKEFGEWYEAAKRELETTSDTAQAVKIAREAERVFSEWGKLKLRTEYKLGGLLNELQVAGAAQNSELTQ